MNKEKLREIMEDMTQRVINDTPISPSSWCESALRINALRGELDNAVVFNELKNMPKEKIEYLQTKFQN